MSDKFAQLGRIAPASVAKPRVGNDPAVMANIDGLIVSGFSKDVQIATRQGPVFAADLRPGDMILTRDHGYQPLVWTGVISPRTAGDQRTPAVDAVTIKRGAFGPDLPSRDTTVSPHQKILSRDAFLIADPSEPEVLIACDALTGFDGVTYESNALTGYMMLLFERHEVILANNLWTESFQLGAAEQTLADQISETRPTVLAQLPARPVATPWPKTSDLIN